MGRHKQNEARLIQQFLVGTGPSFCPFSGCFGWNPRYCSFFFQLSKQRGSERTAEGVEERKLYNLLACEVTHKRGGMLAP